MLLLTLPTRSLLLRLQVPVYRFFFFKQKTAYEMRISDWSSDVCSSDLHCRAFLWGAIRARSNGRSLRRTPFSSSGSPPRTPGREVRRSSGSSATTHRRPTRGDTRTLRPSNATFSNAVIPCVHGAGTAPPVLPGSTRLVFQCRHNREDARPSVRD